MKSFLSNSILALAISALLLASCATKAPSVAEQEPVAAPAAVASAAATPAATPVVEKEKVAKQRTVVTKVPVLVKEASFYSDGLPDEYIVYRMDDAKKNLLEKDIFDASRAAPVQKLLSEYKDGLLVAESLYESDGKLRGRRELGYDADGHLVQERTPGERPSPLRLTPTTQRVIKLNGKHLMHRAPSKPQPAIPMVWTVLLAW